MASLTEAVDDIDSGSTVFIGGFIINANPWAITQEMVRQDKEDLTTIGYGTMSIDLLIGAGCVTKKIGSVNSFEPKFGQPPCTVRGLADGTLELEADSGNVTASRLTAGAFGIPHIPTKSLLGSDLLPDLEEAGSVTVENDPFTGETLALVRAMNPDYAIIHAPRADQAGNVQFFGPSAFSDEGVFAAESVIASVDQIVSQKTIRRTPEATIVPSHKVDRVVEAPFGAFPTSVYQYYDHDEEHIATYTNHAQTERGFQDYLDEYVRNRDHGGFLKAIGADRLADLEADPYYGY